MRSLSTILVFIFLALTLHGQEGSLKIRKPASTSVTRAVIVGISDYEDDGIPDLRFAHKDAQAFDRYLKSPAGGNISADNIQSYFNEKATGGNIHKALYWLVKESKKGDHCIIYFSGHGDVETIYEDEPGHFLAYDSPSSIYQINSLRIDDLKRIVATLSNQKEALVTVITDACRSGKLAGSEVNGAQATAAALSNQFANERKIMSCQANEYSVEGEQWGDGRGIFSYHLIEGLTGLADNNNNSEVTLKEIQRYLEDRFDDDLVDSKQTPVTVGDRISVLAEVDHASFIALKNSKADPDELLASAESGDVDLQLKSGTDVNLESQFHKAINAKQLLEIDITDTAGLRSAEHYFDKLSENTEMATKVQILKGDLIAALQSDAQTAINNYLSLDQEEMNKRWFGEHGYDKYVRYLSKAVSLIDESHFFYPQIKAKEIYFDVVSQRIEMQRTNAEVDAYDSLIQKLKDALVFQSRSPFINNEMGLLLYRQKKYEEAILQYDLAIGMSPTWALLYTNKAMAYIRLKQYDKSKEFAKEASIKNPNFATPFLQLSYISELEGNIEEAIPFAKKGLEINPNHCQLLNNLGVYFFKSNQNDLALDYLDKALLCRPKFYAPHQTKQLIYTKKGQHKLALSEMQKAQSKGANSAYFYSQLGLCYRTLKEMKPAIENFDKALKLDSDHVCRIYLAAIHLSQNEANQAKEQFEYYLTNVSQKNEWAYFDNACANAMLNDLQGFKTNMQKAVKLGFNDKKEMEESIYLSSIRSTPEYQEIISLIK